MLYNEIRLIAAELEDGESRYMSCPSCGKKGKFSITKDDKGAVYHCFRPSCALYKGGAVQVSGGRLVYTRSSSREQAIRPFTGEIDYLDVVWLKYLEDAIGWTEWHVGIGRPFLATRENRVAFPIFSPMGKRRGWSLRSYDGGEPKALTRPDTAEPHTSWYWHDRGSNYAVIVEDIPSAVRVAKFANCISLNGTGCGPDYVNEIAAHIRNVVWALDADATVLALRLSKKWRILFDSSTVLVLTKDFKNMTDNEIKEILPS